MQGSKQQFDLLEKLPHGYCAFDSDLRVIFWSGLLSKWSRIPVAQALGRRIDELFPRLQSGQYQKRFRLALDKGTPSVFSTQIHGHLVSCPLARKEGAFQAHNSYLTQLSEGVGLLCVENVTKVVDALSRYRDLTMEVEESKLQLEAANDTLKKQSLMKSRFLANMSHEIKTPLNLVVGLSDVLQQSNDLTGEVRQLVERIDRSATHLSFLVDDVLDFSKIEAGEMALEKVSFELREVVDEVVSIFSLSAAEKGIQFDSSVDSGVSQWVKGDPTRVRQVLNNILGNAIKFTHSGSVSLKVEPHDDLLKFSVTDTGVGVPQSKQTEIFKEFHQADPSTTRNYGGSGLGLSITKQLVELMEGTLSLDSEEGRGSQFVFTLRLPQEAAPSQYSGLLQNLEALKGRILVVEDSSENQFLVQTLLKKTQLKLTFANDGEEGWKRYRDSNYDAVLMDISMPTMDGCESTGRIREIERELGRKRVPIIGLSACSTKGEIDEIKRRGADAFLSKPIKKARLVSCLKKYLKAA